MNAIKNLLSDISMNLSFDELRYQSWQQEVEKKIQTVQLHLASLMGKSDRISQVHDHLKRVHQALTDLLPDLCVELITSESRNCQNMHQTRLNLLNLWTSLLTSIDKLEDVRVISVVIDTIHKVMIRSEFDSTHLCLDEGGIPQCRPDFIPSFKRYRQLLINTHVHMTIKLSESRPMKVHNGLTYGSELPLLYAKIFAVNFFRLPEVGYTVIECISLPAEQVIYKIPEYERKVDADPSEFLDDDTGRDFVGLGMSMASGSDDKMRDRRGKRGRPPELLKRESNSEKLSSTIVPYNISPTSTESSEESSTSNSKTTETTTNTTITDTSSTTDTINTSSTIDAINNSSTTDAINNNSKIENNSSVVDDLLFDSMPNPIRNMPINIPKTTIDIINANTTNNTDNTDNNTNNTDINNTKTNDISTTNEISNTKTDITKNSNTEEGLVSTSENHVIEKNNNTDNNTGNSENQTNDNSDNKSTNADNNSVNTDNNNNNNNNNNTNQNGDTSSIATRTRPRSVHGRSASKTLLEKMKADANNNNNNNNNNNSNNNTNNNTNNSTDTHEGMSNDNGNVGSGTPRSESTDHAQDNNNTNNNTNNNGNNSGSDIDNNKSMVTRARSAAESRTSVEKRAYTFIFPDNTSSSVLTTKDKKLSLVVERLCDKRALDPRMIYVQDSDTLLSLDINKTLGEFAFVESFLLKKKGDPKSGLAASDTNMKQKPNNSNSGSTNNNKNKIDQKQLKPVIRSTLSPKVVDPTTGRKIIGLLPSELVGENMGAISAVAPTDSEIIALMEIQSGLFSWSHFHSALIMVNSGGNSDVSSWENTLGGSLDTNKTWTEWFSTHSLLFLFTVKEWVFYVERSLNAPLIITVPGRPIAKIVKKNTYINWYAIQGFQQILEGFLYVFRETKKITKPMMTCSVALLHAEPTLINYYLHFVFSRTMVNHTAGVIAVIGRIATWFNEFKEMKKPIPQNFDVQYFISALDVIIETDHHQLLNRVMTMLFDISDVFVGDVRRKIIADFLLKKHFYTLFLHWDEITRNYFHQFLIFKAIRLKQLHKAGLNTPELPYFGRGDGTVLDPESELNNDHALHGKIQCYIQVVQDQLREKDSNVHSYSKNLEIYAPRAMSEYRFFLARYHSWEETEEEWKLIPLALLDSRRRPAGSLSG